MKNLWIWTIIWSNIGLMSNKNDNLKTYAEFWEFYLKEHQHPMNRRLHFVGTSLSLGLLVFALVTQQFRYILLALVVGYGLAWIGHFYFEKNRPATFKYPFRSFVSDFKMWLWILTGRL